jgi:hypothetical protein
MPEIGQNSLTILPGEAYVKIISFKLRSTRKCIHGRRNLWFLIAKRTRSREDYIESAKDHRAVIKGQTKFLIPVMIPARWRGAKLSIWLRYACAGQM